MDAAASLVASDVCPTLPGEKRMRRKRVKKPRDEGGPADARWTRGEEERGESGFESLPTTRRDTCGWENLLRLWKARKWRGLLSPGTRSLSRTCRKVRAKPLLAPSSLGPAILREPPRIPLSSMGNDGVECIYCSLPRQSDVRRKYAFCESTI